jgi:hypothetical protein
MPMIGAFLQAPRAPRAPTRAPLYESHYLTAVDPAGGRAVWLRYTSDKRRGELPRGSLWCTFFSSTGPPVARRTADPQVLPAPGPREWAQIDGSSIGPDGAHGKLEDCAWSVSWQAHAAPLPYLPARLLYDRRLPRSNGAAIAPDATFGGRLEVAGDVVDLSGWRGMIGHNWGSDHADRWIWLHAAGLGAGDPGGWLDLILARVSVGPWLSPWLPSGALLLDGTRRLIRATAARGLRVQIDGERLELELPRVPGGGLRVRAGSPADHTVEWDYPTPGGAVRQVRHCSIATARVTLGTAEAFQGTSGVSVEVGS